MRIMKLRSGVKRPAMTADEDAQSSTKKSKHATKKKNTNEEMPAMTTDEDAQSSTSKSKPANKKKNKKEKRPALLTTDEVGQPSTSKSKPAKNKNKQKEMLIQNEEVEQPDATKKKNTNEEMPAMTTDEDAQSSTSKSKPANKKKNQKEKRPALLTTDEVGQPSTSKSMPAKNKNKQKEMLIQNEEVEQPEVEQKKPQKRQTKCRPQMLVELIKKLSPEQKKAVRDIGFGGLLELRITKIPHGILNLLLKAFDPTCNMFTTKKAGFLLSKDDVHDIFQLPREGLKVDIAQMGNTNALEDTKLKNDWRAKFGVNTTSAPIMVKEVHERLLQCNEAGDEFKRMFVMYSMSIFLAPSSNKTLDLKLVKAVKSVKRIRRFDWCEYVFEEMVKSIKGCKEKKKLVVNGCIVVLMLAYLHQFDFKGDVLPHALPLIQHWDDTKLSRRVDDEAKTGSLGNAPKSKIKYPICQQRQVPELKVTQPFDGDVEGKMETEEGYMMVKLPEGVETDEQLKAKAMDNAHEIYLRMKRDNDLFIARYVENMSKLVSMKPTTTREGGAKEDSAKPDGYVEDSVDEVVDNSEKCASENQTLPFMKDGGYHNFVDMLVERSYELEKAKQGLPSFDVWTDMLKVQYKLLNKKFGGCTDKDLLSSDDELHYNKEHQDEEFNHVTGLNCDDDEQDMYANLNEVVENVGLGVKGGDEEVNPDTEKQKGVGEEAEVEKVKEVEKRVGLETTKSGSVISYLLHSGTVPASADLVPPNLGCSLDCGLPDKDIELVSESMFGKENLYEPVLKLRKEVIDYCFLTDHTINKLEYVCKFKIFNCTQKCDIESLVPNTKIEGVVIESWAILLNEFQMAQKESDKPTRIFYGLAHSGTVAEILRTDEDELDKLARLKADVYGTWDMWSALYKEPLNLKSDMVFIPLIYEEHYTCVCIDFKREKMFYLDNRDYDNFKEEEHVHLAHLTGSIYGEYLSTKGIERGLKIEEDYNLVNVAFDWQTKDLNLDSGLFMMFHMMFFVGEDFKCELDDENKRQLYRGEVAATLVLSDLNESRNEVLNKVENLNAIKGTLLSKLLTKRGRQNKETKRGKDGKNKVQTPDSKIKAMVQDGSASVVGSRKRGKSDGLGCTYNCGVADDKLLVVSRFMRANKALCGKMLTLRKEVLDYCLLDDHIFPLDEVVASYRDDQHIVREDILTLLPNVNVNRNVIDCWSLILNEIEHTEPSETSLMFFGIKHMDPISDGTENKEEIQNRVFRAWDDFIRSNTCPCNLEADLIFIPMELEEHFFCVCINFKRGKVEVLDNTQYVDWEETKIYEQALLVVYQMSGYLEKKNVARANSIISFDITNIKFPWQRKELNNTESGNFLMMHMIRYEGQMFEADLIGKVWRRYYWVEMAAALILADINENRTSLIEKVNEFAAGKDELCKTLMLKRKNREDAKEKGGKIKGKENAAAEREIVTNVDIPTKEKADVVQEETSKSDVPPTVNKEINTEIPILRHSPTKRGADCGKDGDDKKQIKTTFKRRKTVAHKNKGGEGSRIGRR